MSEFIVNLYELRITKVGERSNNAIHFKDAVFDSIKAVDDHLLAIKNEVSDVYIKKGKSWNATRQSMYLYGSKKDVATGVFYGAVEVGAAGSFHKVRRKDGTQPYTLKTDDLSMRDYFYRIEMPPDSALGFLVVQRHGRNTAANALHQTLRKRFFELDHTAIFRLVTDEHAFSKYLTGRISAVRARYIPRKEEQRSTVTRAVVFGSQLSKQSKEDLDIKMKVDRRITNAIRSDIENWLTTSDGSRPKIVTLPVDDDPDRLILCVETDDGRQKQLHPGMIEDMALSVDLTATVKRSANGTLDIESANDEAAKLCAEHRASLVVSK